MYGCTRIGVAFLVVLQAVAVCAVPLQAEPAGPPQPLALEQSGQVAPVLGSRSGSAKRLERRTEIGVGYQGTVWILPTLGLIDDLVSNIEFHSLSVRAWGRKRLGGEFDLALAELQVGRDGERPSRLLVGSVFGKALYTLSHRNNTRFYAGLQLAIPFVNARDRGAPPRTRQRKDASVFSGGLLIGTEAQLGSDSPLKLDAEIGYNVLDVESGSTSGTLEGIYLSGGIHYYFQ